MGKNKFRIGQLSSLVYRDVIDGVKSDDFDHLTDLIDEAIRFAKTMRENKVVRSLENAQDVAFDLWNEVQKRQYETDEKLDELQTRLDAEDGE